MYRDSFIHSLLHTIQYLFTHKKNKNRRKNKEKIHLFSFIVSHFPRELWMAVAISKNHKKK